MNEVFERLLRFAEQWQRAAPMMGLAFAEVTGVTDDGYELSYLSSAITSTSAPARVATFMAGGGRGAYFMPEVGDEVVVGFEMGDVNRPVVLGALWSDHDPPPAQADTSSSNNVRTIVSRAGHQITFDDSTSGKITIQTNGGVKIVLDDASASIDIEARGGIKVKTTGSTPGSLITFDNVTWDHYHAGGAGPSGPPLPL